MAVLALLEPMEPLPVVGPYIAHRWQWGGPPPPPPSLPAAGLRVLHRHLRNGPWGAGICVSGRPAACQTYQPDLCVVLPPVVRRSRASAKLSVDAPSPPAGLQYLAVYHLPAAPALPCWHRAGRSHACPSHGACPRAGCRPGARTHRGECPQAASLSSPKCFQLNRGSTLTFLLHAASIGAGAAPSALCRARCPAPGAAAGGAGARRGAQRAVRAILSFITTLLV